MKYPEYAEVEGKRYKINTDFRYAIECNRIAQDDTIGNYERALGVIYTLFGDEGIDTPEHHEKLLDIAQKYLLCNKEYDIENNEKPDMDYIQDMDYIEASFMSDYHIDLPNEEMHWWKFSNLMNGLSNSEFGNCCILNRIRNLRNYDLKDITDPKERQKLKKAKEQVALHKKPKKEATEEQLKSAEDFIKALGLDKE